MRDLAPVCRYLNILIDSAFLKKYTLTLSDDGQHILLPDEDCESLINFLMKGESPPSKNGRVYIQKEEGDHEDAVKIGVTTRSLPKRFSNTGNKRKIVYLNRGIPVRGIDVFDREMKKKLERFRIGNGGTEWYKFPDKLLERLLSCVTEKDIRTFVKEL